MRNPEFLRVFLSSPGDVALERDAVQKVVKEINDSGEFRRQYFLEVYRWDDEQRPVPMFVTVGPQQSVNEYLIRPSLCDLVVVIFWSRLGTPTTIDGKNYLSGTHYEYSDAFEGNRKTGKPDIWVYRCEENYFVSLNDPMREAKIQEYERVNQFFEQFRARDGHFSVGINLYPTHDYFETIFKKQLLAYLRNLRDNRLTHVAHVHKPTKRFSGFMLFLIAFVVSIGCLIGVFIAVRSAIIYPPTLYFIVDATIQNYWNIDEVAAEIEKAINYNSENIQVGLRIFGNKFPSASTCPVPNTEQLVTVGRYLDVKDRFLDAIHGIVPFGNGSLTAAILEAVNTDLAGVEGDKRLFVITSSIDPLCEPAGGGILETVGDQIRSNRTDIDLLIIATGTTSRASQEILTRYASAFGGQFIYTSIDNLQETIETASNYGSVYLIENSTPEPNDNENLQ